MTLNVALIQARPPQSEAEALQRGQRYCREARELGAELVLFPELWQLGYRLPATVAEVAAWQEMAITEDSTFIKAFADLARELGLIIVLTFLARTADRPRNGLVIIDKQGIIQHRYAKVHTCAWGAEQWCAPGRDFPVSVIQTSLGPVRIGTMICFDREFPESARLLMLGGAELILVPNACEMEQNRRNQLQSRAFENMVGIALANYTQAEGNGGSVAFDGMAFLPSPEPDHWQSRDQLLVEASADEGIYLARFPLQALRDYRAREVWGNAWRRVDSYQKLLDPQVDSPFIRTPQQ